MIAIETGVPLKPAPHTGGKPYAEETVAMMTMAVGDSFMVTDYMRYLFVRGKLTKMRPRKFSMRKTPGGWRLWRVE